MCQPRNHFHQTPKSSSHTVIMQFEFSVIHVFARNFTCLLGKLQTKSMGLIGNSISLSSRGLPLHTVQCMCILCHSYMDMLLTIDYYLNLQVSGTCIVADILTGGNYSEFFALQCSYDLEVSQIHPVLSDKKYSLSSPTWHLCMYLLVDVLLVASTCSDVSMSMSKPGFQKLFNLLSNI